MDVGGCPASVAGVQGLADVMPDGTGGGRGDRLDIGLHLGEPRGVALDSAGGGLDGGGHGLDDVEDPVQIEVVQVGVGKHIERHMMTSLVYAQAEHVLELLNN